MARGRRRSSSRSKYAHLHPRLLRALRGYPLYCLFACHTLVWELSADEQRAVVEQLMKLVQADGARGRRA